jgi:hypothetical protein
MLAVLVSVAAILMLAAGGAKVIRPDPATDALGLVGLGVPQSVVRLGAGIEVLVALAALLLPGPVPSLLLGVSYLGFAGFVLLLRRTPGAESCGCFGTSDEPPSMRHVLVNLLIAAGCIAAAVVGSPSAGSLLRADWSVGALFVVLSLTAAWLVALLLRSSPGVVRP